MGFGYPSEVSGEVVFNTGMVGYPESLTDPSYSGQILVQTYPLIGNYGKSSTKLTNNFNIPLHFESGKVQVMGYCISELQNNPNHWAQEKNLSEWLNDEKIPGISGIDTRELTKKLRMKGVMKGILKVGDVINLHELLSKINSVSDPNKNDLVKSVSVSSPIEYSPGKSPKIVLIDCGVKFGILRELLSRNVNVIRVPYDFSAEEILKYNPDGIIVSNGPGDPKLCTKTIQAVSRLLEINMPIMGVCLGSQILGLAAGGDTYKLKFGHRAQNHPCMDLKTGRVYITTQNHGYTVSPDSLKNTEFEISHVNVNDKTVEGIKHKTKSVFGVQWHPEGPGPLESSFLFDNFLEMIKNGSG